MRGDKGGTPRKVPCEINGQQILAATCQRGSGQTRVLTVCSHCGEERWTRQKTLANGNGPCRACSHVVTVLAPGQQIGNYTVLRLVKARELSNRQGGYLVRDNRCGHEKIAYNTRGRPFTGLEVSCGCPVRQRDKNGYVRWAWRSPAGQWITVPEHRIVKEQELGRELLPSENVHHVNGRRDDNRPENLELWSISQPSGQRVADKTEWAIAWLQFYAPERLASER